MADDPYYTTGDLGKVLWVIGKGALRAVRGKSPEKYTPELAAIKATAQERERLAAEAREKLRQEKLAEQAKKRAERGW